MTSEPEKAFSSNDLSAIRSRLLRLFGPLCMETFFMMLSGIFDTLMLSSEGDLAVGAVGTANSYIRLIIVTFNIASTGMVAVMSLYIGAGRENVAYRARRLGLLFNAAIGAFFSLFLLGCSTPFLRLMGTSDILFAPTEIYIRIVGFGCLFNALIPILSGHLRAFGHTKQPFFAAMFGNVLNVILNAYFLYRKHYGVAGVAAATVISYIANLLLLLFWSQRLIRGTVPDDSVPAQKMLRQILKIGLPSACEGIIYTSSVTIMVSLLNRFDPSGFAIAARSYALEVSAFSHCASSAFSQSNAISAGWYIGALQERECSSSTHMAAAYSASLAVTLGLILAIFSPLYMPLFTQDPQMVTVVTILLFLNAVLEIGRAINMCYGATLKAIGDAVFPMSIGIVFMMLFAAGGTYVFCSVLQINPAIACFSAMTLDECTRAVLMRMRWQSGIWKRKRVI